jgi:hypothetical protein
MTDYQFGLPQDDPGRIPDRPLFVPKPANPTASPQAIPEQQLSSEPAQVHPATTKLREMESAPYPVSPTPENTQPVPPQNPETAEAIAIAQAALAQAAAALAAASQSQPRPAPAAASRPQPASASAAAQSQPPPVATATAAPSDPTKPALNVKPKRNWGDIKLLAKYYLTVASEVLFSPSKFFAQIASSTDMVEPAVFMAISVGISCILRIVSGDISGIFAFFGRIFCVLACAFIATYGMKALASKGDFPTLFRIFAYSQAPMIISWITLGAIPIGGFVAIGYSIYLSIVGLEQVYRTQRTQAAVVVIIVVIIARGIAGLLHIL